MKFINLTYGLKGQSKQYTYLVNDNVKVGQVVFPAFRHLPDGKIAKTVGIVQTTNSVTSKDGINMAKMMNEKGIVPNYITTNLNKPNEVFRDESSGKFIKGTSLQTEIGADGNYVAKSPDNWENVKTTNRVSSMQDMNAQLVSSQPASNKEQNANIDVNGRGNKETFQEYVNKFKF